jgi:ABC-type transporter Mla subunit MlaD
MFTRGLSLLRPRRAPNGGSNMARKTDDGVEHNQPPDTEVEAEIREFVRRDVVTNRERQPENESEMVTNSINSVLQGATTTSVQEIDKLITELQSLSDRLNSERARVQREIVEYSTLTRAALESTKIIAESLTQLTKTPDAPAMPDLTDQSVAPERQAMG